MEESSEVWMVLVMVRRRSELESNTCWSRVYLVLGTSGSSSMPSRQPHAHLSGRSHQHCRRSFRPGVVQRSRATTEVQSGRRLCEICSTCSMSSFPPRWNWVLTRSDSSPTTYAPPRCSWQRWKKFRGNFALGRETYPHAVWLSLLEQLTRDRGIYYRASDQRHWKGLEGHALSSAEDFQQWNIEAYFAISVRFRGEEGGLRMKLTFFVSQASANFCDGPL